MLFIGYPVTYAQATKFVNLPPTATQDDIQDRLRLNQIGLYYIYRDIWGVGKTIYELTPPAGHFYKYKEGMNLIDYYKDTLMINFRHANIDLSNVSIAKSREGPIIQVQNPEPYIIKLS
jgi:hypothetical protein